MAKNEPPISAATFRDRAFKSRTLILPDGRAFAVAQSRIVASDPVLIEWLDKHAQFEREVENSTEGK